MPKKECVHDVGSLSGDQLEDEMKTWVRGPNWTRGVVHKAVVGGDMVAKVYPRPTPAQPGNGVIKFNNGAPKWGEVEKHMDKHYPKKAAEFNKRPLADGFNPTARKTHQALFMQKFEVGRRVSGESHPSGREIRAATDRANEQGRPKDALGLYRGKAQQRKKNLRRIMTDDEGVSEHTTLGYEPEANDTIHRRQGASIMMVCLSVVFIVGIAVIFLWIMR